MAELLPADSASLAAVILGPKHLSHAAHLEVQYPPSLFVTADPGMFCLRVEMAGLQICKDQICKHHVLAWQISYSKILLRHRRSATRLQKGLRGPICPHRQIMITLTSIIIMTNINLNKGRLTVSASSIKRYRSAVLLPEEFAPSRQNFKPRKLSQRINHKIQALPSFQHAHEPDNQCEETMEVYILSCTLHPAHPNWSRRPLIAAATRLSYQVALTFKFHCGT
jgi:hypothetical protein